MRVPSICNAEMLSGVPGSSVLLSQGHNHDKDITFFLLTLFSSIFPVFNSVICLRMMPGGIILFILSSFKATL